MKQLGPFTLSLLLGSTASFSIGQPAIEWQRSLGGTQYDRFYAIEQTDDGGYIMAGETTSADGDVSGGHGSWDFWVVKIDAFGTLDWQRCLGGSNLETAGDILQTNDGGYVVLGAAMSNDGDVTGISGSTDLWMVKLNASGELQWQQCYGGAAGAERGWSVKQTPSDGGFIAAGYSSSGDVPGHIGYDDVWVLKIDASGNLQWQKCLGGSDADEARSIEPTADNGYILSGRTYSDDGDVVGYHSGWDFWVVKLNSSGMIQWQQCLGGSERDEGQDIQQTMDGGFIAVGTTSSNDMDVSGNHGGDGDVWVVKLSADGQLQWQKCLGGPSTDEGYAIHQASDGGYLVAGMAGSDGGDISGFHGYSDFWLLKLDTLGNVEWQKCLGGSYEEVAYAFMVTADGGNILTGITGSTNGDVTGFHGSRDGWVVKLAPYDVEIAESPTSSYPTYPIPASDRLNVALTTDQIGSPIAFLDAEGRMVLSARVESTPMDIDISLLVNGTYVLLIGDHYRSRVEVVR